MMLLCLLGLALAAPPTWMEVRQVGVQRRGAAVRGRVAVVGVQVVPFSTGPRTTPDGAPVPAPELPSAVERIADRAARAAGNRMVATGEAFDLTLTVPAENEPWTLGLDGEGLDGSVRDAFSQGDADRIAVLRVSLGQCPRDGAWVACVRSADVALGAGPPAVEGAILRRRPSGRIRRRTTLVWTPYRYTRAERGWVDRPFLGEGDDFEAQAIDAVEQAAEAWLAAAVGRRRVKRAGRTP